MYQKNDVVTVITYVGEFVGKLVEETPDKVTLKDPRMFLNTEEGMGFARGVAATGEENPTSMSFFTGGIIFVSKTNSEIDREWHRATSGILV